MSLFATCASSLTFMQKHVNPEAVGQTRDSPAILIIGYIPIKLRFQAIRAFLFFQMSCSFLNSPKLVPLKFELFPRPHFLFCSE